ncbi:MAG: helix-turn-helix transcriptional regulator [Chloroflexota bacterium]
MNTIQTRRTRHRVVVDDTPLARAIGQRIRQARLAAGLTQQQLAGERFTKAYISALENALAKPSMAALNYLAPRLGTNASAILADPGAAWGRIEVDLNLAAGQWAEAVDGYVGLLEVAQERGARAELQLGLAEALCRLDRPAEAIRPATEASAAFADLGREAERAWADYWLSSAHYQQDNPDEARSLLRAIHDRIRAGLAVQADFATRVLIALAMNETGRGEIAAAIADLEEARSLAADLDIQRRGTMLASLARAYQGAGDLEGAFRAGTQAHALLRQAESELEIGRVENELAMTYLAAGNATKAGELAAKARSTAEARGDVRLASHVIDTQAVIALSTGDADMALRLADEAQAMAQRAGHAAVILDASVTRARALAALGRHDEAAAAFAGAARAAEHAPPSRRRAILTSWAESLAALGRHDEAFALARQALATH